MPFPDRLKLPFHFDPVLLARDLASLSSTEWTNHFVRQNYEGNWSAKPLRSGKGETHPLRMIYSDPACREFVDTPLLQRCAYFQQVLGKFQCELRCVRLMRLGPGSQIKEHTDVDLDFEAGMVRIHVPVVTSDLVEFYLNQTRVVLEAGSCWYLRLSDPHRVSNHGSTDRVHLVIDAFVNDWVKELFTAATASRELLPAA
jgi:hypothetical protein